MLCLPAMHAWAGPVEQPDRVLVDPGNPDRLVLSYANNVGGLVVSEDGGKTWAMTCHSAAGLDREPSAVALAADGRVFMGLFDNMLADQGGLCSWDAEPAFEGKWVSDMAHDPANPQSLLAITSSGGQMNGIFERIGSGEWNQVGLLEEVLITRLHVASLPGGGRRFYESGAEGQMMVEGPSGLPRFVTIYMVRYSDDEGQTWTKHVYGAVDGSLKLVEVDPTNPDRIVIHLELYPAADDQVLVSDDRGETFRELLSLPEVGGTAMAPDGTLWVGGTMGGLYSGNAGDSELKVVDESRLVTCLQHDAANDRLYVCSNLEMGSMAGGTGDYETMFEIQDGQALLDCGTAVDVPNVCEEQFFQGYCKVSHFPMAPLCWDNYPLRAQEQANFYDAGVNTPMLDGGGGPTVTPDAGVGPVDGSNTESDAGTAGPTASSGCAVGGSATPTWAVAWLLALLFLRRRRG